MTYPYDDLANDATNSTTSADEHPDRHNAVADALNAIKVAVLAAAGDVEIVDIPNEIAGSGTIRAVMLPADTPAFALGVQGEDFPRWLFAADTIYAFDGTADPYASGNTWVQIGPDLVDMRAPTSVFLQAYPAQLNVTPDGIGIIDADLTINGDTFGVILTAPDDSLHRIKVANDGTLSTELVT